MNNMEQIDALLQTAYPDMVRWRRHLHRNPELSFQEKETSRWIARQLADIGCEPQRCGEDSGLTATIKGSLPGPVVALRADIDALPIQDEKDSEYRSIVPGVMHACGHDAHTATMLAIARYFMSVRDRLAGEVRLLFQPAEEITPGGALGMIRGGALDGVDAIYGVHLWTPLPYGVVASRSGPLMAAPDEFYIDIAGRGGHGGLPHDTVDAIIVGTATVQMLQTIVSRNVDPTEPAVVSVGSFHAGTTANVIAERCRLVGTVRTFTSETRARIKRRLETIVGQTAELFGAEARLDYRDGYPTLINDETETERFFRVAENTFGPESVRQSDLIMAGEDFSYYLREKPGCFMFVGAGNEDCGAVYPHHHPKFDLDERAMLKSAKLLIAMAEDYLASDGAKR